MKKGPVVSLVQLAPSWLHQASFPPTLPPKAQIRLSNATHWWSSRALKAAEGVSWFQLTPSVEDHTSFASVELPAGATLQRTLQVLQQVYHIIIKNPAAHDVFQVDPAFLGQRHAPGGPVEEPRADVGLQFGDVLADRRRRQAQSPSCRGEAVELRDVAEYLQRRISVHPIVPLR